TAAEITQVSLAPLSEDEIAYYIQTREPMDKAGAYAIQGIASRWVERIEGCYFNVVGLPLPRVYRMLQAARVVTGTRLFGEADISTVALKNSGSGSKLARSGRSELLHDLWNPGASFQELLLLFRRGCRRLVCRAIAAH